MKIVLAPDSFKSSMTAMEVCRALEIGARRAFPDAEIIALPLADGGEGTLAALTSHGEALLKTQRVKNPLSQTVNANWGILPDGRAVIEMAQASGIGLIKPAERDAMRASSFGTGQLIKAALNAGCREILLGLGGSATCDAGVGALSALGLFARDAGHRVLPAGGAALSQLDGIDPKFFDARVNRTKFTLLCDVNNPLCGSNGAARVYAAQKGASAAEVIQLDDALKHFADVAEKHLNDSWRNQPGAGAAGGLGFAMLAFCNAQFRPGIEVVMEATGFHQKIAGADLILTGEGALDEQTLNGKAVAGVSQIARLHSIPVLAFAGKVQLNQRQLAKLGLKGAFALASETTPLSDRLAHGPALLSHKVEEILKSLADRFNFKS